jgi:RNA-binding protein YhbY
MMGTAAALLSVTLALLLLALHVHAFSMRSIAFHPSTALYSDHRNPSSPTTATATATALKPLVNQFTPWTNPSYSSDDINNLWKENEPLLSIGKGGVTDSHANSLKDLIMHHLVVKVKLSTDKLDPYQISKALMSKKDLEDIVVLVEIRKRGLLFAKK